MRLVGSCFEQARLEHAWQRDWHFVDEEVFWLCFDRAGIATSIELRRVVRLGFRRLAILVIQDQVRRLVGSQLPRLTRRTGHADLGSWLVPCLLRQACKTALGRDQRPACSRPVLDVVERGPSSSATPLLAHDALGERDLKRGLQLLLKLSLPLLRPDHL